MLGSVRCFPVKRRIRPQNRLLLPADESSYSRNDLLYLQLLVLHSSLYLCLLFIYSFKLNSDRLDRKHLSNLLLSFLACLQSLSNHGLLWLTQFTLFFRNVELVYNDILQLLHNVCNIRTFIIKHQLYRFKSSIQNTFCETCKIVICIIMVKSSAY